MHLIYIDDSHDESICVFSALTIPATTWNQSFKIVQNWRLELKESYEIGIRSELHSWKLVSGRGTLGSPKIITKFQRSTIFASALKLLADMPSLRIFNALGPAKQNDEVFARMLNRINRTLEAWNSYGMLICDEGNEGSYTKLVRKMRVFNPIPSRYETWKGSLNRTKNIPIVRIIEDPFFKNSERSYFIQMADMTAYALLQRERPNQPESRIKYNIHQTFNILSQGDVLVREATRYDPEGILRIK